MTLDSVSLDGRTLAILLVAGLLFVGLLALSTTGNVAAVAGSEVSSCAGRLH